MPDERVFIIDDTAEGQRLDKWLAGTDMELTRTGVQSLMEKGAVTVNGKAAAKNYKCKKYEFSLHKPPKTTSCCL